MTIHRDIQLAERGGDMLRARRLRIRAGAPRDLPERDPRTLTAGPAPIPRGRHMLDMDDVHAHARSCGYGPGARALADRVLYYPMAAWRRVADSGDLPRVSTWGGWVRAPGLGIQLSEPAPPPWPERPRDDRAFMGRIIRGVGMWELVYQDDIPEGLIGWLSALRACLGGTHPGEVVRLPAGSWGILWAIRVPARAVNSYGVTPLGGGYRHYDCMVVRRRVQSGRGWSVVE